MHFEVRKEIRDVNEALRPSVAAVVDLQAAQEGRQQGWCLVNTQ